MKILSDIFALSEQGSSGGDMLGITILTCPVCPHCGVEKVAFQLIYQCQIASSWYQLWICGNCSKPACSTSSGPLFPGGNGVHALRGFYPLPEEITAPHATPEPIANAYRSAERLLQRGEDADFEAACIMARRSIEQAVNNLGGAGKTLFQKINDLESKRLIPPAMRDWAHHIREIGNEGAHGEATEKDAAEAVYFAEMLFTYLYTLPAQMKEYQKAATEHATASKNPG